MGKSTKIKSPTIYKQVTQLCFFNGFASSVQLGMRLTVVPHVFEFVVFGGGFTEGCESEGHSTTPSRGPFRRNFDKNENAIVNCARFEARGREEWGVQFAAREHVLLAPANLCGAVCTSPWRNAANAVS